MGLEFIANVVWAFVPCALVISFMMRPRTSRHLDTWFGWALGFEFLAIGTCVLPETFGTYARLIVLIALCLAVIKGTKVTDKEHLSSIPKDRVACAKASVAFAACACVVQAIAPDTPFSIALSCSSLVLASQVLSRTDVYFDPKTGALQREGLQQVIAWRLKRGKVSILGVALDDYEDLRMLNGEDKASETLKLMARYLENLKPNTDVAYLGRGRFLVVGDDSFDSVAVADQVVERYHQPWETQGMPLLVSARLAALSPTDRIQSAFNVLATMDTAMDEAVLKEVDKLVVEESMLERFDEHARVYRSLVNAMENDAVEVYLQPLYSTVQQKPTRAEALARLKAEDGSFISPEAFISIAEGAGLINQLGEQIFEKVCMFAQENDLDALGIECINVNLSPLQCMSSELPERLFAIAEKHKVNMDKFHLEITESAMVDVSVLRQQMGLIITTGSQFSLDDYGTGYSNLTRMASLPFANVKIDHSIVWDYFNGTNTFLPYLISTFHNQGFEVTAEGVETKEMKEGLEAMRCELLQGFYFSRPLPPDEFVTYMRDARSV